VKEVPVPRELPPEAAANQLIVPPEAAAPRVTVPVPQRAAGVVPVIDGVVLTVTVVEAVPVQLLASVTVIVYVPDIAVVALAETIGLCEVLEYDRGPLQA
jgi:hypothetical protein